jgi:hypothetical protein
VPLALALGENFAVMCPKHATTVAMITPNKRKIGYHGGNR